MQIAQAYVGTMLFLTCTFGVDAVHAATYYVSASGTDVHSCTQAQSPSATKRTLGSALTCLSPGDTLYVRGGTYPEALINEVPSGISWSSNILIAAYPGETVWLKPLSGTRVIEFSRNQQYIEFDGINLDARNTTAGAVRIEATSTGNPHHIRFQNAEFIGTPYVSGSLNASQGVLVSATFAGAIGYNEFINLRVHGVGGSDFSHGFYIQSSNNLIDHCEIYDIPGAGIHIYNGSGFAPNNNIVRRTIVRDGRSTGANQRGWGILSNQGSGTQIYNNLVYNIRNSYGSSAGIYVQGGSNLQIYNNTVFGNAARGIYVASDTTGSVVRNNVVHQNAGGNFVNNGTNVSASHNLLGVDPLFANPSGGDFRLQPGSPAIDVGTTIAIVVSDLRGMLRPQGSGFDVGAYEFVTSVPPPMPPMNVRILSD
jgi:parallel beta-helix repeat protein